MDKPIFGGAPENLFYRGPVLELSSMLIVLVALPAIDPMYATNITVYHVNEHKFGAIPVNMDSKHRGELNSARNLQGLVD